MVEEVNKTLWVFIPKVPNPQEPTQFGPISLCNVSYKMCSKATANRMRIILDDIVPGEPSAFVPVSSGGARILQSLRPKTKWL